MLSLIKKEVYLTVLLVYYTLVSFKLKIRKYTLSTYYVLLRNILKYTIIYNILLKKYIWLILVLNL